MIIFPWTVISILLTLLSLVHIDASSYGSMQRAPSDQCAYPDVAMCDYIQCENGRCEEDKGSTQCFKCICSPGFSGQLCEIPIATTNNCNPPCQNGGQCQQTSPNMYTCVCPLDYTGTRCETSIIATHPCVTMPNTVCQNGGTCTMNGADYICNCAPGWAGTNCERQENITTCDSNPCGGHGTCIQAISPDGPIIICNCQAEWTGKYCDVNPNEGCPIAFCLSGGTCQTNGNVRYCICPSTHTGARCETPLSVLSTTPIIPTITTPGFTTMTTPGFSTVTSPGISTMTTPGVSTMTTPGFSTVTTPGISTVTTPDISTVTTPALGNCSPNSCLNGGSCFNIGISHICLCRPGWSGQACDILTSSTTGAPVTSPTNNPCTSNPCNNGGRCFKHGNGFVCVCTSAYQGSTCAELKTTTIPAATTSNPGPTCQNQPCKNGGTCYNAGSSYFCYCGANSSFSGKNCDMPISAPMSNCPLNCAPGYCVPTGSGQNAYACMCNGVMTPSSCSST